MTGRATPHQKMKAEAIVKPCEGYPTQSGLRFSRKALRPS
jgi:hypothetical protein